MLNDGVLYISELECVTHMRWSAGCFDVSPRAHSALAFRVGGEAVITTAEGKYRVGANDVLYMPQGVGYRAEYTDTDLFVAHFKTVGNDIHPEVYTLKNSEELYKLFLKMNLLWKKKEAGYRCAVLSLLYRALSEILRERTTELLSPEFLACVSYMNSNFADCRLSVKEICREAGISETGFRALMKRSYGKTSIEYITGLRLEHARSLISCGSSVAQAALESGFSDPKYFSRSVKKHFGCTPRELKLFAK